MQLILLCLPFLVNLVDSEQEDKKRPLVKGQQLIKQATVARVEGGPIPQELLTFLKTNLTEFSQNFTLDLGQGKSFYFSLFVLAAT